MLQSRNAVMMGLAALMLMLGSAPLARAQDKPAGDATGTWKWTAPARGNNATPMEFVLKLKQDGDKVTGTLNAFNSETEIKEGMVKDGQISFAVTRTRNNQEVTTKYTGKLEGDTIKGKTESTRNGQAQTRDWEAKRGDAATTQPATPA